MSPVFDAARPAGAYDDFRTGALARARHQRDWSPADGPLPALYLSHGAPPLFRRPALALPAAGLGAGAAETAGHSDRVRARETAPLCLSAPAAGTQLVYDFGGFHPRYYQMTYATPDAAAPGPAGSRGNA